MDMTKDLENIADSEQSSYTPGQSYQRYAELISYIQISLTIASIAAER